MAAIDGFLARWDAHEVHAVVLDVTPERAVSAALAAPAAPDLVVRTLLTLRGLAHEGSIEELFLGMGFEQLHGEVDEVVFGGSGTPWRRGPIRGFAAAAPGTVRIAADLRAEPLPEGGSRLSTETRVVAVDAAARRAFRRYWRVVGPFSALIRRRWLAGVRSSLSSEASSGSDM